MPQFRLRISKLDAARRQMETAVRLYFNEADPVSVHTLAAAAHQILADLSRARSGGPMLTELALDKVVRPEKRKEAAEILRAAANFLKHADRDPTAMCCLLPSQSEFLLFDAVQQYRTLTNEMVPVLGAYWAWFWLGPGKDFVDVKEASMIERFRAAFAGSTRRSFFATAVTMLSEVGP